VSCTRLGLEGSVKQFFLSPFTSPSTVSRGCFSYHSCPIFFSFFSLPSYVCFLFFIEIFSFLRPCFLFFSISLILFRERGCAFSVVTVDVTLSRVHLHQYKFVSRLLIGTCMVMTRICVPLVCCDSDTTNQCMQLLLLLLFIRLGQIQITDSHGWLPPWSIHRRQFGLEYRVRVFSWVGLL
jgi:hypothetical protein